MQPGLQKRAFIFFKFNGANNMSFAPVSLRKIDDASFVSLDNAPSRNLRIWLLVRLEKWGYLFFYSKTHSQFIFDPKNLGNPLKTL